MKRILLVDDSRTCRQMYRRELESDDFEIIEAEDGLSALECIHNTEIDLVVLDIEMPNMDGYEVCERLRSKEFTHRFLQKRDGVLPIIFVTSTSTLDGRLKSYNMGATDFINKGFKGGVLLASVNRILKPHNPLKGMTALVADDSSFQRNMVAGFLKENDIKVIAVPDGSRAFDIMLTKTNEIDMVITDLEMPGMTGDELCRRLRKDLALTSLPIIIITASDNRRMLLNLFEAGASDYLIKPFEKDELLARLKASLKTIDALEKEIEERVRAESMNLLVEEKEEQARVADEAEMATSALHNIGNVLNSVYASCYQVQRQLKESRVRQLMLAHQLIEQNRDRLSTFFTEDPKGRILPEYLIKSSEKLNSEHGNMAREIEEMLTRINLMKDIIETQQAHARGSSMVEPQSLEEIVNEALKVLQPTITRYNVTLKSEFSELSPVPVERVSLAHVLINLFKNAVEAMRESDRRVLTVNTLMLDRKPSITVSDTGSGITAENLKKIFTHGFTTKNDGHGFGLAFCARAIDAMGGRLTVSSPGEGKGARFLIQFGKSAS